MAEQPTVFPCYERNRGASADAWMWCIKAILVIVYVVPLTEHIDGRSESLGATFSGQAVINCCINHKNCC